MATEQPFAVLRFVHVTLRRSGRRCLAVHMPVGVALVNVSAARVLESIGFVRDIKAMQQRIKLSGSAASFAAAAAAANKQDNQNVLYLGLSSCVAVASSGNSSSSSSSDSERMQLAVGCVFVPQVHMLSASFPLALATATSADIKSAAAANNNTVAAKELKRSTLAFIGNRLPLLESSPLYFSSSSSSSAASPAGKRRKQPSKKANNNKIVHHAKIKSSGYGSTAPVMKMFAGAKTKRAARSYITTQFRGGSNNSKPKKKKTPQQKPYPMQCGRINCVQKLSTAAGSAFHNGPIARIRFSATSSGGGGESSSSSPLRLLTASYDSTACVTRMPFHKGAASATHKQQLIGHNGPVRACAWACEGKRRNTMLTCSADKSIRMWGLGRSDPVLQISDALASDVSHVALYRRNQFIVGASQRAVRMFRYRLPNLAGMRDDLKRLKATGSSRLAFEHRAAAGSSVCAFACSNAMLSPVVLYSSSAKHVHALDMNTGKVSHTIRNAHAGKVHTITMMANARGGSSSGSGISISPELFMTSGYDSSIRLWDMRTNNSSNSSSSSSTPSCVCRWESHVNRQQPVGADVSPCARYIATGSEDKLAYVYDWRHGGVVDKLAGGHTDVVSDVAFNPLRPQIVTGCYDGSLRFFSTTKQQ
jgi:WD40 repeat protein